MRKIVWCLPLLVLLSSCGIFGGGKSEEAKEFCATAESLNEAGVLRALDGSETAEELRAYEENQAAVDDMAVLAPGKVEEPAQALAAAYDDLVQELAGADFDVAAVDPATLADLNERMEDALGTLGPELEEQCDTTLAG